MNSTKLILVAVGLCISQFLSAQNVSNYNAQEAFAPLFYPAYGDDIRTADGRPGSKYWQNKADYRINVTLDDNEQTVSGSVQITYKNNSPNDLSFVWLQLDQNIYNLKSRGVASTAVDGGRWANRNSFNGGDSVLSVDIIQNGKQVKRKYEIYDTRMKINLPAPLKANGGIISFRIMYSFKVPEYGTDRMGTLNSKNGIIYEIAQWYPRMCVYDNVQGWNTLPYLGQGEFYLEYGDITYNIKYPQVILLLVQANYSIPRKY